NGRRRTRDGQGEARADRSRCCYPVARRFGRARNHPQVDAIFLQSDARARHRNGGGSSQAVDLRDGLRSGRQPRPRRVSLQRGVSSAAGARYDDKDVQERIVRNSKLDWVIVRPVLLTDGPKTNAYRVLVDPRGWTCGFISRADVADFLVKQIVDDAFLHKTPVLTS